MVKQNKTKQNQQFFDTLIKQPCLSEVHEGVHKGVHKGVQIRGVQVLYPPILAFIMMLKTVYLHGMHKTDRYCKSVVNTQYLFPLWMKLEGNVTLQYVTLHLHL